MFLIQFLFFLCHSDSDHTFGGHSDPEGQRDKPEDEWPTGTGLVAQSSNVGASATNMNPPPDPLNQVSPPQGGTHHVGQVEAPTLVGEVPEALRLRGADHQGEVVLVGAPEESRVGLVQHRLGLPAEDAPGAQREEQSLQQHDGRSTVLEDDRRPPTPLLILRQQLEKND